MNILKSLTVIGFIKDILRDQEGACSDWDKAELGIEKPYPFENHYQSV